MKYIESRKGDEDAAEEIAVTPPMEMWPMLRAKEFVSGCWFQRVVKQLLDEGCDVPAWGLAFDFRGEPFGSTPDLALLAEGWRMWMTSCCTKYMKGGGWAL